MKYEIEDLLKTTSAAFETLSKLPKTKMKERASAIMETLTFFTDKFPDPNQDPDGEKTKYVTNAARVALNAASETGIYNRNMLKKLFLAQDMYCYQNWCMFMAHGTDNQKELMGRLDNDWMSEKRIWWIMDRYDQYKVIQKQLLDPDYDDKQASAMWTAACDYAWCLSHDFDPATIITKDMPSGAICSVIQSSRQLISENADPVQFLSFLSGPDSQKYRSWRLVKFIAENDFQYPATVSWKDIVPVNTADVVLIKLSSAIKTEGLSPADREAAAKGILSMWDGFTDILETYYNSIGVWGHDSIHKAWQQDLRDKGPSLEMAALACMASKSR